MVNQLPFYLFLITCALMAERCDQYIAMIVPTAAISHKTVDMIRFGSAIDMKTPTTLATRKGKNFRPAGMASQSADILMNSPVIINKSPIDKA